jgi:hypothetical protein
MIEKITLNRRIHTNLDSHPFGSFYFFWSLHLFLSGLDLTDIHRLGLFLIIVDIPARNRRSSPRLGRRSFFHHHLFMRLPYFSLYGSTWIFSFSSLSVLAHMRLGAGFRTRPRTRTSSSTSMSWYVCDRGPGRRKSLWLPGNIYRFSHTCTFLPFYLTTLLSVALVIGISPNTANKPCHNNPAQRWQRNH